VARFEASYPPRQKKKINISNASGSVKAAEKETILKKRACKQPI
jgi:hypothetical protein